MELLLHCASLDTPVGALQLFADGQALYRISFPHSSNRTALPCAVPAEKNHPLLNRAQAQLTEYFAGSRKQFDLPFCPQGTIFQQAVWKYMRTIPYGKTKTYGQVAAALGNRNKARAVGGAANKNPLPLVIPCHRVIGSSGRLTGFAGGLEIKRFLLELERCRTAEHSSSSGCV
ncbi:MAG: methylated-DNA--[protein]-cysteine S-methyltransferase [Candidatus Electrothrix sp. YB6]